MYSSADRILIQTDHILIHKPNLNEFERIDIWNNFFGFSGIKIEIKEINDCRVSNSDLNLNNTWAGEVILVLIRVYYQRND